MKRLTQAIVGAPERAPIFAYFVAAIVFGLWTYRMFLHVHSGATEPEGWKHVATDGGLLLIAFCAYPGFMKYMAANAGYALDFYKRLRAARESKSEDRASNQTLPPRRGGDGL